MRRRHPAASWRPDLDRLRGRLAAELRTRDSRCPDVGAAALLARGVAGADVDTWASLAGVTAELVRRAEAGELDLRQVPTAVLGLADRAASRRPDA